MNDSLESQPLTRFTVLDLTRVRSGPTAVRQLADWGANVIKIEAPSAMDSARGMGGARDGPDFQNIHRNKRGMTLNLKSPDGHAVFMRMAEKADVVVENFRPDVKERLGIDYQALCAVNPGIVLASISGFGQDGPYAMRPGFDQIAQGMGGLMSITPGQGPVRVGVPIADLSAGLYAAIGILVALLQRDETGKGQWVRTSLLQAQIAMLDFQAARWTIGKEVPPQAGNNHPTSIPTGVFRSSDGYINIACSGDVMWKRLCEVLGAPELFDHPDYADGAVRLANRDALNAALESYTEKRSSDDLVDSMNRLGVPCGPIYSIDEVFADPQVQHLGMSKTVQHATLGPIDVIDNAVIMGAAPEVTYRATPTRGQHTGEVLAEFGYDVSEIEDLIERGVV